MATWDVVLCNAKAYPRMTVERRKYRFRFLAGGNSRAWRLRMSDNSSFLRIGKDWWLFPEPQETQAVMLSPANARRHHHRLQQVSPRRPHLWKTSSPKMTDVVQAWTCQKPTPPTTVAAIPSFKHRLLRFDIVERDARYPDATVALGTGIRPHRPIRSAGSRRQAHL